MRPLLSVMTAVLQGVIYLGEQYGGDGSLLSVEFQRPREVEIGQEVFGDHYERLIEVLLQVLHPAGCAGQLFLHFELDRKPLS